MKPSRTRSATSQTRTVSTDLGRLTYTLTLKAVKHIYLRVTPDGDIRVSAPRRMPLCEIDRCIQHKAATLIAYRTRQTQLKQERPQPQTYSDGERFQYQEATLTLRVTASDRAGAHVERIGNTLILSLRHPENAAARKRAFERWLRREAEQHFGQLLTDLYPAFAQWEFPMPRIQIRAMTSKWGSCHYTQGKIVLNLHLMHTPTACIAYVIAHELCHFVVPNHSAAFYAVLTQVMPDWSARRALLNRGRDRQPNDL